MLLWTLGGCQNRLFCGYELGWLSIWKWKSLSRVQLFATPWIYSPWNSPGQSTGVGSCFLLQGIFPTQRSGPRSPALQADSLPAEPPGKPMNIGVSSRSLLQRIFLTQESNRGLLHCRRILYQLNWADLLEKIVMLARIEGRRRRGWQRMRWLDGISDSMDMSLSKLGDSEGQGSLMCRSPWGHKESDTA